jgi:heat shock protein HslJ
MEKIMKYLVIAALALAGCVGAGQADEPALPLNESSLAPDFSKMDWVLNLVDGKAPGYSATLNLGEPGRISGQAPCNSYSASLTRAGQSFQLGPIAATKMACLQIKGEAEFFALMAKVQSAETMPGMLILTSGTHKLEFAQPVD